LDGAGIPAAGAGNVAAGAVAAPAGSIESLPQATSAIDPSPMQRETRVFMLNRIIGMPRVIVVPSIAGMSLAHEVSKAAIPQDYVLELELLR
jgi:hypothetical protein